MRRYPSKSQPAFGLVGLIIVVVIIGIVGAIAVPRLTRGAAGTADSALAGNLSILRSAIDLYATEHDGQYPSLDRIVDQLTRRTDGSGNIDDGSGAVGGFICGPYLREIPPLPVGDQQGQAGFTATLDVTVVAGWVYDEETGRISANASAEDPSGLAYNKY